MLSILPISDLRNNANEISDFCHQTREPVYITRNGTGDMVVISMEAYERQQALIDLYGKLAIAEQEIASGAEGEDFLTLAKACGSVFMETYKIKIFPTARQDLEEVIEYLNTLSPDAALKYYDLLVDEISSLS